MQLIKSKLPTQKNAQIDRSFLPERFWPTGTLRRIGMLSASPGRWGHVRNRV